jgi:hypothetical protein
MSDPHKLEWRIVCAAYHGGSETHRHHVHDKPSKAKAVEAVERNNAEPMFLNPTPGRVGCLPWHHEHRVITPWQQ